MFNLRGQRSAKKVHFDLLNAQTQYRYSERRRGRLSGAKAAEADTKTAPVILPGAPGSKSRAVAPDSLRSLELAEQSVASQEANAADRQFTEMMIPHHYQAIVMSRMAAKRHADPELLSLARRIKVEQTLEIMSLQGWQARNELPVTAEREAYRQMLSNPAMLEQMGMATRAEIRELRGLSGAAFDAQFLNLMIPHHVGAVDMSEQVNLNGSDLFIRQFSTDLLATQGQQIYQMEQMQED